MIVIGQGKMMSEKVEITMMNGFGDSCNNDSITSQAFQPQLFCQRKTWLFSALMDPLFSVDDEGLKVQPQDTGQTAPYKGGLKVTWGRKMCNLSIFDEQ